MNRVWERIYIGSSQDFVRPKILAEYGITAILNVADDLIVPSTLRGFVQAWVPLTEAENEPELYLAAIALLQGLLERHTVFVGCHNGRSRSCAVVIGYLDLCDPQGWDYWYKFMNEKCGAQPAACHRDGFNQAFLVD